MQTMLRDVFFHFPKKGKYKLIIRRENIHKGVYFGGGKGRRTFKQSMDVNSFVYINTEGFEFRFERKLNKFKPVIVGNPTLQGKRSHYCF